MDKVIELPKFLHGIRQIKNNCWYAGDESGREVVRKEIAIGTFDIRATISTSSHGVCVCGGGVMEAIDAFVSCDYATPLYLDELDVEGLKKLYVYETNDEPGSSGAAKIVGLASYRGKGKGIIG